MKPVTSWGRLSHNPHHIVPLNDRHHLAARLSQHQPGIAHGMGRAYGDACLNSGGHLWTTPGLDRFIRFDADTGALVCEAGVLLRDIQQHFIPRGWALPVTPGTQLVTVGGAIANDVHGKNHHRHGTFGDHVLQLGLLRTDGEVMDCGPDLKPDWYAATVGGMGLTGLIHTATLQLHPVPGPWLQAETLPFASLDEFFQLSDASEAEWEHTVAWIDCLGHRQTRGLFSRANPVAADQPSPKPKSGLKIPVTPPVSLVNDLTLKPFNFTYYHLQRRKPTRRIVHYEPFSYPLDNLLEWNRIYGPKGFYQYQSVIPCPAGPAATRAMLAEIARMGEGSFLAVLKTFGDRMPQGMLSFPRPGVTLALDFPNRGQRTSRLFDRLDAIVSEAGGRLYPAKDARMPASLFAAGYPRLTEFLRYRDPGIRSDLSRRLMGD